MAKSARDMSRMSGVPPTSLLTLAERRILDSSVGRSLAEATQKQLQSTLAKARLLRNKWQDLFKRQTVAAKRTNQRGESVNTRSLDKSELFAAAVKRIEARITQAADAVAAAVTALEDAAGLSQVKKRVQKPALKPAQKKTASKAAAKAVRTKATAAKQTPGKRPAAGAAAPRAVPAKKSRQAGVRKALKASATGQAIGYDPKKQRSAKASATRAQLKLDGLATRRRGHDITSGKRKQARRDNR